MLYLLLLEAEEDGGDVVVVPAVLITIFPLSLCSKTYLFLLSSSFRRNF
jgi:hypothetical protein